MKRTARNHAGSFEDLKTKQLEQPIGEYTQAQLETLDENGRELVIEPGRYPVVTVAADHVAGRIEHGAIVFDVVCETGEERTVMAVKSAQDLRRLVREGTLQLSIDPALLLEPDASWSLERHPAFEFAGPSGDRALADIVVLSRAGAVPVVVATERDDNPGVSIVSGVEYLAAQLLVTFFADRIGEVEPFLLVEHDSSTFALGDRDLGALTATFQQIRFGDFHVREEANGARRIGDAVEWKNLDERVAESLAAKQRAIRAPSPPRKQRARKGLLN
ncbi:MAG: hypothetical protein ACLPSH_08515 [Vulcanimicrobiaceae bacterium]